jgi:hypothetical protein
MKPVQGRDDVYNDFPQQERRHFSDHPSKRDVRSGLARRMQTIRSQPGG